MAQSVVRLPLTSTTPPRTRSRGRPKGRLNNATLEVRAFFRDFFESPRYRENLERRILAGEANHMEILGHYYAYGKPKSTMGDPGDPARHGAAGHAEGAAARAVRAGSEGPRGRVACGCSS